MEGVHSPWRALSLACAIGTRRMLIRDKHGTQYHVTSAEFAPGQIAFHVTKDAIPIARAALNARRQCVSDVIVYDLADRRKGIVSELYDYIEREMGIKLVPNRLRLADGKAFWKSRQKPLRRALGAMTPIFGKTGIRAP